MSVEDRKIGFYNLQFKKYKRKEDIKEGDMFFDISIFKNLLEYIDNLSGEEKVIKIARYQKAIAIEKIDLISIENEYLVKMIFKSCKYNHNPQYMSSIDGSERKSDKKIYEGEKEKTHLCMRIYALEAKVILEERQSGVSIKGIVEYFEGNLKKYLEGIKAKKNYKILHGIIPTKDFKRSVNGLKDAKIAEMYTHKKMLGSEGYNFLEREDQFMKDDIVITAKAKPQFGLGKDLLLKAYESLVTGESKITRIRIYGIDSDNNPVKIDSEIIKKLEYVRTKLDIDGTVNSDSIFEKMVSVLEVSDE